MTAVFKLKDGFEIRAEQITVWPGPCGTVVLKAYHGKGKFPEVHVIDVKRLIH